MGLDIKESEKEFRLFCCTTNDEKSRTSTLPMGSRACPTSAQRQCTNLFDAVVDSVPLPESSSMFPEVYGLHDPASIEPLLLLFRGFQATLQVRGSINDGREEYS